MALLTRFRSSIPWSELRQQFRRLPGRCYNSTVATAEAAAKLQELAMMEENCILVNERDEPLGNASKRDCHRVDSNGDIRLHRAFSVFLFNSKGEMLLQRRSTHKITFPDCYTNACCSHPLHDIEGEREELNALGIRRAAQRRLNYELGIPLNQVRPENFHFLTRIHYLDRGDGIWGEHEVDYILFLQKDVDLKPNESEVREVRYISRDQLDQQIGDLRAPLTPWFRLILAHRLKLWWDNLHRLKKFENLSTIERF
ncbi:isopentenyl-diphosphate Delta-isomerase 1 [Uranotaenia lowii]|uniref:isopentenyl-diphosphate Delta-isomerase 1 n=1 Tax=Uranotaenia lowii TaxID=190385 RepID=UPI00247A3783|nr:isopentenyl-diphosphate Delta-isomerase 1 [Uranotaenia lowii]